MLRFSADECRYNSLGLMIPSNIVRHVLRFTLANGLSSKLLATANSWLEFQSPSAMKFSMSAAVGPRGYRAVVLH